MKGRTLLTKALIRSVSGSPRCYDVKGNWLAHEVQIATYRDALRALLDVTNRLAAECGYTDDDMQRIPAVARAKEMAK